MGEISRKDLDAGRVDLGEVTTGKRSARVHPGRILRDEFLRPMGISAYRLAKDIAVPGNRVSEILAGRRAITEDTAVRLGLYFGMDPRFWVNLQTRYTLEQVLAKLGVKLRRQIKPFVPSPKRAA